MYLLHFHHHLFLFPGSYIILKWASHRVPCIVVDEIATKDEISVLLLYHPAETIPTVFIVQDAAQMYIRYRIYLDGVALRDFADD